MGLFDDPAYQAADIHNVADTGQSFIDSAEDFVVKGVPLAVASGLYSMRNTMVSLGNTLGGDFEKSDLEKDALSYDDDLGKYYQAHKDGIDLGGFVATSFVPGMAGIKALKLIQAGKLGESAARVTSLFTDTEKMFLAKAESSIQQETNQVFKMLDANKLGAIAAGAGEQALQAAAFETGVLLVQNQSPVINKEDQDYFQNILYNTPELLKNAALGGVIGGGINALVISGKLKNMIRQRDADDFPSLRIPEVGLSDLDTGTKAGIDFAWLTDRQARFEQQAAEGSLNDRQIANYRRTQAQKQTELRLRLTEELAGGDAELGKQIWEHLNGLRKDTESAVGSTGVEKLANNPKDIATTILGAANSVARITEEDLPAASSAVINGDGYLSPRHAKNILLRGKFAPGTFDAMDDVTSGELAAAGFELYRDSSGNVRVIQGTPYAKKAFARSIDATKHQLVVKLSGDNAGAITEAAYPVIGDLGKVTIDKEGKLLVNKVPYEVPAYNPLENTSLQSNAAFTRERLTPSFTELEENGVELHDLGRDDLPVIEKAFREGYDGIHVDGFDNGETAGEILRSLKQEWRQELINSGHDFDRIARELNVTKEFAETGGGDGFALSTLEDHTVPQYAKFSYNTKSVPDGNYMRGVQDLQNRLAIGRANARAAAAFILGDAYALMPQTNGTMLGINTIPELSGFVQSASADYGTFGQLLQQVGKVVESLTRKRFGLVMDSMAQAEKTIRSSPDLQLQLNYATAKIRSYGEPLAMIADGENGAIIVPKRVLKGVKDDEAKLQEALEAAQKEGLTYEVGPEVAQYFSATQEINASRVNQWNMYFAAKGSTTSWDADNLYLPPVNTRKYPFVAFVRESAEREIRPVSVITATDAASLEAKIRSIRQNFGDTLEVVSKDGVGTGVFTKTEVANFHKLQGDYESGLLLGNSSVDNSLAKKGILSDFQPRTDSVILDDFNSWHWQQEQNLVRNAVELQYAQEFAELRAMGEQFTEFQKSMFGKGDERLQDNPYLRYISTALGKSNFAQYDSVWGKFNAGVEGLGQTMFKAWDSVFNKERMGTFSTEELGAMRREAEKAGFRPPYADLLKEVINPLVADKKIVEPLIGKANAAVASLILRLDPLNAIVNILGSPALMASELAVIKRNLTDPNIVGALGAATSVAVPGTKVQLPSTLRLISKSISNFISDDGSRLEYYKKIGAVQGDLQLYKQAIDATALTSDSLKDLSSLKSWTNNLANKTAEVGAKLTGNNLSERFVRFVAADVMKQLVDIAKVPEDQAAAYINTFVNRVHGNFVASQRPALFQGAVGSAISLFQTFQFNVMQNMVRYVERNDKMAVAAMLGLQNSIFGLQGNPAFYLLNSYIGNQNREHVDLTSGLYGTVGKDVGDWLLYGLGSNAIKTNLYNRGDLTPRYVTVVPTNLTDTPAISIGAKAIGNIVNIFGQISKGASLPETVLNGIAHNGFNRPLAGLGQLAQGYRTTTNGNLLVAYNDIDGWLTASKVLGGEGMNQAVAIDAFYRNNAYKAADKEKLADVGEAMKSKLYKNQSLSTEDVTGFAKEYARAGGKVESFNKFMVTQMKAANTSQVNKMMEATGSPLGKNLGRIMGGDPLEDYYYNPPAQQATAEPQ
jgi:hypothetical protein